MNLRAGAVIEFRDKKDILLAICKKLEGKSVRILTESGKEFSYPAEKVARVTAHMLDPSSSDPTLRDQLVDIRSRVQQVVVEIELADLWELYADSGEEGVELSELAETYFGAGTGSDHESAMLRALNRDPLFFKRKGEAWVPKSADAVHETQRQIAELDRRQRERDAAIGWLRAARLGRNEPEPEGLDRHLAWLEGLAVFREEYREFNDAAALVRDLGEEVPDGAFRVLVDIGKFSPDENLLLRKERVPTRFKEASIEEARRISETLPAKLAAVAAVLGGSGVGEPGEALPREDLRALETFSIDDSETRDIDDALSVEPLPGGTWRVGVHIADASALLPQESALDLEALRRSTTLYLPDGNIPMLPETLSHEAASLVAGEDRLTLTLFADLDAEANVLGYRFVPSLVTVRRACDYAAAAIECETEGTPLAGLHAICGKLRAARVRRGARVFHRAELKVRVDPDGSITVKKREGESPADVVVSELMILANQIAGTFLAERNVPGVYRVQPPPDEEVAQNGSQPISRKLLSMVRRIQVQTTPGPHWGLGLPSYAQMTSPIRRYLDLVVHRQIRRALGDESCGYETDRLLEIIGAAETAVDAANNIQRWSTRYWLLKYLTGRIGEVTPAAIQEVRDDFCIVQLAEYLMDVPLYPPSGRRFEPGEQLEVRIKSVDPRRSVLRVEIPRR